MLVKIILILNVLIEEVKKNVKGDAEFVKSNEIQLLLVIILLTFQRPLMMLMGKS